MKEIRLGIFIYVYIYNYKLVILSICIIKVLYIVKLRGIIFYWIVVSMLVIYFYRIVVVINMNEISSRFYVVFIIIFI